MIEPGVGSVIVKPLNFYFFFAILVHPVILSIFSGELVNYFYLFPQ